MRNHSQIVAGIALAGLLAWPDPGAAGPPGRQRRPRRGRRRPRRLRRGRDPRDPGPELHGLQAAGPAAPGRRRVERRRLRRGLAHPRRPRRRRVGQHRPVPGRQDQRRPRGHRPRHRGPLRGLPAGRGRPGEGCLASARDGPAPARPGAQAPRRPRRAARGADRATSRSSPRRRRRTGVAADDNVVAPARSTRPAPTSAATAVTGVACRATRSSSRRTARWAPTRSSSSATRPASPSTCRASRRRPAEAVPAGAGFTQVRFGGDDGQGARGARRDRRRHRRAGEADRPGTRGPHRGSRRGRTGAARRRQSSPRSRRRPRWPPRPAVAEAPGLAAIQDLKVTQSGTTARIEVAGKRRARRLPSRRPHARPHPRRRAAAEAAGALGRHERRLRPAPHGLLLQPALRQGSGGGHAPRRGQRRGGRDAEGARLDGRRQASPSATPPRRPRSRRTAQAAGFAGAAPDYALLGAPGQKQYTGQRITLEFHDIDVRNLLRLLADVSKKNIVVADDVQGKITVSLRNVPWDQALDIVLQVEGARQAGGRQRHPRRQVRGHRQGGGGQARGAEEPPDPPAAQGPHHPGELLHGQPTSPGR